MDAFVVNYGFNWAALYGCYNLSQWNDHWFNWCSSRWLNFEMDEVISVLLRNIKIVKDNSAASTVKCRVSRNEIEFPVGVSELIKISFWSIYV